MKCRTQGFSLIELMIVVALAAAVLAIGAPGFKQFRLNNRLSNAANDTLSVITSARTEAIKRQKNVAVCRTDAPTAEDPKCSADSTAGWIAFVDDDNDCVRGDAAKEPLVTARVLDNTIANDALRVKTDGDCLQFGASGFRQPVSTLTVLSHVAICDSRGMAPPEGLTASAGRGLLINRTGRARITRVVGDGTSPDDLTNAAWSGVKCPS